MILLTTYEALSVTAKESRNGGKKKRKKKKKKGQPGHTLVYVDTSL